MEFLSVIHVVLKSRKNYERRFFGMKYKYICLECGKKFEKKIGKESMEVKCPKCGSYCFLYAVERVE